MKDAEAGCVGHVSPDVGTGHRLACLNHSELYSPSSPVLSPCSAFFGEKLGALTTFHPIGTIKNDMTLKGVSQKPNIPGNYDGMQIKKYDLAGKSFMSLPGSEKVKLYTYLDRKGIKTFTTVELADALDLTHSNVSSILNKEYRAKRVYRSGGLVYVPGEQNATHIYTLLEDDHLSVFEGYLIDRLSGQYFNVVEAYRLIRESGIYSSIDLRIDYDLLDDYRYLLSFVKLGLIHITFMTGVGDFFYNPQVLGGEELEKALHLEREKALKTRSDMVSQGVKFEKKLKDFIEKHRDNIIWKCVDVKYQEYHKIGHKQRRFDIILYFRMYFKKGRTEIPFKYFSGAFVVPVEVKASHRSKIASGRVVDLHILESREVWDSVYPVVVGDPTDTAFKSLEEFTVGVVPTKFVDRFIDEHNEKYHNS